MTNPVREAGRKLRDIRNQLGMTMEDVDERVRQFAAEHNVNQYNFDNGFAQGIQSRIELGKTYRPPSAVEMAKFGVAFHMTPAELFQLYGLPVIDGVLTESQAIDERVNKVRGILANPNIPDDVKERFRGMLDLAITQALYSMAGGR